MRNDSKNEKEWITLKEAAKCSIYSKRQVQKLAEKGNKMKSLFTIYNQRLAGYLMMNGFPLLRLTENKRTGKNDFIFANVPMLQD